jgi:Ca-activated chloride channel family protein
VRADAVEAVLRALSAGDRFAVVAADLNPRVVYPAEGLAPADEKNVSKAIEKLAEVPSAGATDLGEMFSTAFDLLYDAEQPAVVYIGDGLATVGETSSLELTDRLRRALGDSRTRLFTIAVGADANHPLLDRLARVGGGRSFNINTSDQTVQEALKFVGMLKTPTITDLKMDVGSGLDQVFTTAAGKLSEGDEVILLARTHHALPDKMKISWRLGGKDDLATYEVDEEKGSEFGYIPILWARQYLTSMMGEGVDENRGRIISLGLSYSIMTPFTSFLVLESDAAYMQQGIRRRPRYFSGNYESDESTKLASASDALSIPLGLFGCMSKSEDEPSGNQSVMFEKPLDQAKRTVSEETPQPSPPVSAPLATAPVEADETAEAAGAGHKAAQAGEMDNLDGLVGGSLGRLGGPAGGGGTGSGYGRGAVDVAKAERRIAEDKRDSISSRLGTAGPIPEGQFYREALIAAGNLDGDADSERPFFKLGICSDSSSRPLWERRILWSARLRQVTVPSQYARIFFEAGERCELPAWRDRKVMLDLIEGRINGPAAVQGLLASFQRYPAIQKYLRHRILRRTLDPNATMGLRFPDAVNWNSVLTGLAALKTPEARIEELKRILARNPTDPIGRGMLVRLLVDLDMIDEALAEAQKLRRDDLAGPNVLEILCDLQADAGQVEEARRTCSELVEFNSKDPNARQRLGDLFLRHGWYEEAYRQYLSLVAMLGDSAASLLRLAAAASGMGKVDEALRIERKVASGDGEPGPGDPRRWARLHSAARLAQMLIEAREQKKEDTISAMERSLKRTQVFGQNSTVAILVWEDFEAGLKLTAKVGKDSFPVSEQVLSPQTGLAMIDLGQSYPADLRMFVEFDGKPLSRAIPFTIFTITWDGKQFTINRQNDKVTDRKERRLS